jgi:hypothetical protein
MEPKKAEAGGVEPADLESTENDLPLPSTPTPDLGQRFDWLCDPTIVIKRQPAVAVYLNPDDCVVIRQEAEIGYDEDSFVFVQPDQAVKLIGALRALQSPLRVVKGGGGE